MAKKATTTGSVDGKSVTAEIMPLSATAAYSAKCLVVSPRLGADFRAAYGQFGSSMVRLGEVLSRASEDPEVAAVGLAAWATAWADRPIMSGSIGGFMRAYRTHTACLAAGVAPVGDRVARVLARDCAEAGIPLQSASAAMIATATATALAAKAKATPAPKAGYEGTATAELPDTLAQIRAWKAAGIELIAAASGKNLEVIRAVLSNLIESAMAKA